MHELRNTTCNLLGRYIALFVDLAIFIHIQRIRTFFCLNQQLFHFCFADIGICLPLRRRISEACCLGFYVIHRSEIIITACVINGYRTRLVVGRRVILVERLRNNCRIRRKIQTQSNIGRFICITAGLMRDQQLGHIVEVSFTGRVNCRCNQSLASRVHHIKRFIEQESTVTGIDILQAIGGFQRKKTIASNRDIQRICGKLNIALTEFLANLFKSNTLTDCCRGFLQRGCRKDIAEVCARALETGRAHVGNVITGHR